MVLCCIILFPKRGSNLLICIIRIVAESEEELKNFLMRVKESEKAGLKLNIQNTKTIASNPITSWQIDREKVETVADFIFMGSKITVDGDYSHENTSRI